MSEMIQMPISINVLAYSRPKSDLRYLPVDQGHRGAAQVSGLTVHVGAKTIAATGTDVPAAGTYQRF